MFSRRIVGWPAANTLSAELALDALDMAIWNRNDDPLDRRRSVDDVELATLSWVHWWNTTRFHSAIGNIPPIEFEAAHYAQQHPALTAGNH